MTRPVRTTAAAHAPRFNARELVMITVMGQVAPPIERGSPYRVGQDGVMRVLPGSGGIVLSHRVGDACVGLAADHVEPGVSIRSESRGAGETTGPNQALQSYACVGNTAVVTSGRAAGARGVVTGKHGGIDNVLVDFPLRVMRRMAIGDRVQVYSYGVGLRLPEFPAIKVSNCAPRLLRRWGLVAESGRLTCPVALAIPAQVMGSGLGRNNAVKGDYDIQMHSPALVARHGLGRLRFGDLVSVEDADNRFGRSYAPGWRSVGVVVHSESTVAGHGPGVVTLLTGPAALLRTRPRPDANIARILAIRPLSPARPHRPLPEREAAERAHHALARNLHHVA